MNPRPFARATSIRRVAPAAITAAEAAAAAAEIVAAEIVALVAYTSATIAAATFIKTHNPVRLPGSPAIVSAKTHAPDDEHEP